MATITWSVTSPPCSHSTKLPIFIGRYTKNINPESDRQVEPFRVLLEILRHLILRDVASLPRPERKPGQAVEAGRGERASRVPSRAPVFSQTRPPLEDDEVDAPLRQLVARRKSVQAATDHYDPESLDSGC